MIKGKVYKAMVRKLKGCDYYLGYLRVFINNKEEYFFPASFISRLSKNDAMDDALRKIVNLQSINKTYG